jgi:hypothetical protein
MSGVVITSVEQATPEWLTTTLSASGALTSGMVVDVDVDAGHGNRSNNARLLPRSSVDASGDCPTSLFLKMVNINLDDDEHFGNSEVAYYTRDYVDVPDAPLVRCHHAAHSKAKDGYHLFLDDIVPASGRHDLPHPQLGRVHNHPRRSWLRQHPRPSRRYPTHLLDRPAAVRLEPHHLAQHL